MSQVVSNSNFAHYLNQIQKIRHAISSYLVGQHQLVERLLMALLCNGHVLVEGLPGTGKTLAIRLLASSLKAKFSRIQFTADMQPADLIGVEILQDLHHNFEFQPGPIFANLILADEINRAPAKVQSALLESMQEHQVTVGGKTYRLPEPFLVMATQNPVEMEGTYRLPEAQTDRFMFKVKVTYPSREEEVTILERMAHPHLDIHLEPVMDITEFLALRSVIDSIYCSPDLLNYLLDIVFITRLEVNKIKHPVPKLIQRLQPLIEYGVSSRASLHLLLAAKAHAFLHERDYLLPEDIQAVCLDSLRHRFRISYEAEAENISTDDILNLILSELPYT